MRGIKLMSHTMKLWERISEKIREKTTMEEEQFGFMPGRSMTDAIFPLSKLLEKHREERIKVHMVFIDKKKEYNRVPRQEIRPTCVRPTRTCRKSTCEF